MHFESYRIYCAKVKIHNKPVVGRPPSFQASTLTQRQTQSATQRPTQRPDSAPDADERTKTLEGDLPSNSFILVITIIAMRNHITSRISIAGRHY